MTSTSAMVRRSPAGSGPHSWGRHQRTGGARALEPESLSHKLTILPAFRFGDDDWSNGLQLLACQRDQLYLMPPSVSDWLERGPSCVLLARCCRPAGVVGFYEHYRSDGLGRAAYEPSVMVSVLLYAYCVGERSSRGIERRCGEDVAFRVVSPTRSPTMPPSHGS